MAICKDHIRNDKKELIGNNLITVALVNNPDLTIIQLRRIFFNTYYRLKQPCGKSVYKKNRDMVNGKKN
jgi:hypothetical protein